VAGPLLEAIGYTQAEFGAGVGITPWRTWFPPCVPQQYRNLYHAAMKTTLDIDDRLLANAKAFAARRQVSLTRLIEEGLRLRLRGERSSSRASTPDLPRFLGAGGLRAGVDPTSNKSMLAALDDDA
jgi:hypothetical protein